jgi:glycosyltransferase involved in cell wall biosynthesis
VERVADTSNRKGKAMRDSTSSTVDPAVSVVIPLHNKAGSVRAAVTSALVQSIRDLEVIVIDDGSSDSGADRLSGLGDPRLRVIRQENAGVSAARNAGVAAAGASWIAFLDADDVWAGGHLATLLAGREGVVACFSNIALASRNGKALIGRHEPAQRIDDYFRFARRNGGYPVTSSSILVEKAALLAVGGFPVGRPLGEDVDTWCRLACHGPFYYSGACTAFYDDAPNGGQAAHQARPPEPHLFPARLPFMEAEGLVPRQLVAGARRYANFLTLEYARQLIDRGLHGEARKVLLEECHVLRDPARYVRRLARTFAAGRALYGLDRAGLRRAGRAG